MTVSTRHWRGGAAIVLAGVFLALCSYTPGLRCAVGKRGGPSLLPAVVFYGQRTKSMTTQAVWSEGAVSASSPADARPGG